MTESQEDYLKMISFLSDAGEVRVTDIAISLGVSKPSVLAALKSLEEKELIIHQRYGGVLLTEKGKSLATKIRERHELLKNFLRSKLDISKVNAGKDACRMEHILSEETIELIKKIVQNEKNRDKKPQKSFVRKTKKITSFIRGL